MSDVTICPECSERVLRVSTVEGDTIDLDMPPVPPETRGAWVLQDLHTARRAADDDGDALIRWRAHAETCAVARERAAAAPVRTDWTREELIELCGRAIVPESKWGNRDSAEAHRKIGAAWAQLRAGCEFEVIVFDGTLKTDAETIWITIWAEGFQYHEWGERHSRDEEHYYIPTPQRLDWANGEDWY